MLCVEHKLSLFAIVLLLVLTVSCRRRGAIGYSLVVYLHAQDALAVGNRLWMLSGKQMQIVDQTVLLDVVVNLGEGGQHAYADDEDAERAQSEHHQSAREPHVNHASSVSADFVVVASKQDHDRLDGQVEVDGEDRKRQGHRGNDVAQTLAQREAVD